MSTAANERCVAQVSDSSGYHLSRCPNRAKYGKYCGVHAPEKQAERARKRGPTQFERECARRDRHNEALDELLIAARLVASDTGNQNLRRALERFDEVTKRGTG